MVGCNEVADVVRSKVDGLTVKLLWLAALSEVTTDVGCTFVVGSDVEDFKINGGNEVALVLKSIVDDSTVVLAFVVENSVVATDVGSTVVVTAGVEDCVVVEKSSVDG